MDSIALGLAGGGDPSGRRGAHLGVQAAACGLRGMCHDVAAVWLRALCQEHLHRGRPTGEAGCEAAVSLHPQEHGLVDSLVGADLPWPPLAMILAFRGLGGGGDSGCERTMAPACIWMRAGARALGSMAATLPDSFFIT